MYVHFDNRLIYHYAVICTGNIFHLSPLTSFEHLSDFDDVTGQHVADDLVAVLVLGDHFDELNVRCLVRHGLQGLVPADVDTTPGFQQLLYSCQILLLHWIRKQKAPLNQTECCTCTDTLITKQSHNCNCMVCSHGTLNA